MNAQQAMEALNARGIMEMAQQAGWQPHELYGRMGWLYPVHSSKVPGHSRWKAADSNKGAKYLWEPKEADERPRYYFVNGIKEAIARDNGRLFVASGEPDVLAYGAAGKLNCLCWFGEKNIPDTLVEDLQALGVSQVVYVHDCDPTGEAAAESLAVVLAGSGIRLVVLDLPGESGSHYDINRFWMDQGFDTARFWEAFNALPVRHSEHTQAIDWEREYTEWCEDVERTAVHTWGIDDHRKAEWSRKLFQSPIREDRDPSCRWNYETHGFKDFGTDEFYNTKQCADFLKFESWEDRKVRLIDEANTGPTLFSQITASTPAAEDISRPAPAPQTIRVVSRDEAISHVWDWLYGKVPPSRPIVSPFRAMHQLGGFAELWERRKLIYVIGAAGMGKTAWMETAIDHLNKRGISGIGWGPEWTPEEVQMKAIARHGGPSFTKQRKAHLWAQEELNNIPASFRHGAPLTDDEVERAGKILADMLEWPGKMWYLDRGNISISEVMQEVGKITAEQRTAGHDIAVFFCDYLQKSRLPGSQGTWHELEDKANVIWQACVDLDLVGVVASQVGKQDSRALRKNARLDHGSAQGLSDQLCNLYITLNPVFDRDGNRLERGVLGVEKNNNGAVPAQVCVKTALYRHFWSDEVTDVSMDEVEKPTAPAPILAGTPTAHTAKEE